MKKRIISVLLVIALAAALCFATGVTAFAAGSVKLTVEISPKSLTGAGTVSVKATVQNNTDNEITDVSVTFPGTDPASIGSIAAGDSGTKSNSEWEVSSDMLDTPLEFTADFTDANGNEKSVSASATITKKDSVVDAQASASVDKKEIDKGGKVKFTFVLENNGNVTLEKVSLKAPPLNGGDQLGDTFTLKAGEKKTMTWSPTLSAGVEVKPVFSYTANGEKGTAKADTVSVKIKGEDDAESSASAATDALSISATADSTTVATGSTVAFQLTIKNSSFDKIRNLKATDSAGNNVKLSATTVEGNGSITGTASIVAEKTDSISFTVTGEDADGNSVKATSSPVSITVQEVDPATAIGMDISIPTLTLTKAGPVEFTFIVKNNSGVELKDVKITEATLGDIETIASMTDAQQEIKKSIEIDKTTTLTFQISATLPDGTQVEKAATPVTMTLDQGIGGMGNMLMILLIVVIAIVVVAIVLGVFIHKNKKAGFTAFGKPRNGKGGKNGSNGHPAKPINGQRQAQGQLPQQRPQQHRQAQQKPRNHMSVENIEPSKTQQRPPKQRQQKPPAKKGGANYTDRNKF